MGLVRLEDAVGLGWDLLSTEAGSEQSVSTMLIAKCGMSETDRLFSDSCRQRLPAEAAWRWWRTCQAPTASVPRLRPLHHGGVSLVQARPPSPGRGPLWVAMVVS